MSCPLFRFCRDEARMSGAVTATGSAVAEVCGDVQTVDAALQLASGQIAPNSAAEAAVASHLGRAAAVAARLVGGAPANRTA